jgi:Dolichyl-phosphate-mannose-protein mannosyltransferase
VLRAVVAARLPLSGDEAYYWEWSRHLALGYYDHPPMVAWLIALFSWGTKSVVLIRLPFVLCGLGAAVALAAFTNRATNDPRAGATVALLLSLAPFGIISFTQASPDGPYLLFWAVALYCALRAFQKDGAAWWLALGLAVGACTLSRVLGLALAAGLTLAILDWRQPAQSRIRGGLTAAVAFAVTIGPFLLWNAAQQWAPLAFAFFARHADSSGSGQILRLVGLYAIGISPSIFVASCLAFAQSLRRRMEMDNILIYTAAPLIVVCIALSFRERVEFYWADGPFLSLLAAIGLAVPLVTRRVAAFAWAIAPAALFSAVLFAGLLFPLQTYKLAARAFGTPLRHGGPFEIWSFEPAAHDLRSDIRDLGMLVLTDGYGLSSVLDFYGGIPPVVIGYDPQGSESRKAFDVSQTPSAALFFDKEPLATRPDFQRRLARACLRLRDGGTRDYYVDGVLARTYYVTRCEGLTPAGMRVLLWETE